MTSLVWPVKAEIVLTSLNQESPAESIWTAWKMWEPAARLRVTTVPGGGISPESGVGGRCGLKKDAEHTARRAGNARRSRDSQDSAFGEDNRRARRGLVPQNAFIKESQPDRKGRAPRQSKRSDGQFDLTAYEFRMADGKNDDTSLGAFKDVGRIRDAGHTEGVCSGRRLGCGVFGGVPRIPVGAIRTAGPKASRRESCANNGAAAGVHDVDDGKGSACRRGRRQSGLERELVRRAAEPFSPIAET